jgi:hypothetical protein
MGHYLILWEISDIEMSNAFSVVEIAQLLNGPYSLNSSPMCEHLCDHGSHG